MAQRALTNEHVHSRRGNAGNPGLITPPEMGFHIRTPAPIILRPGTIIAYTMRLHGAAAHRAT